MGDRTGSSAEADLHTSFRGTGIQVSGSGDTHIQGNVNINVSPPIDPQVCRAIHFPPNDDFVPRSTILERINQLLPPRAEYQNAALWGLGGSGKTQLALDYAYRRCSDPACSVFWVHADSDTSFAQDYKWIAKKLKLDNALEGKDLLAAVRGQIESLPQWVLVLDNADDLGLFGVGQGPRATDSTFSLLDYVPRGTVGTVLWTSRDKLIAGSLVRPRRGIHVTSMTNSEGEVLLETTRNLKTKEDEANETSRLLAELGCLPLAISQAAAYMRRTKSSIPDYLGKIHQTKNRKKVLGRSEPDPHRRPQISNSVLETWNISVEHIQQESEMVYNILHVLAFLDSQNITFRMIVEVVRVLIEGQSAGYAENSEDDSSGDGTADSSTDASIDSTSDSDGEEYEEEAVNAVARLEEFSFLSERISEGNNWDRGYNMHQLVQEAILYNLHLQKDMYSKEAYSAKTAFHVTNNLFPKDVEPRTWDTCEQYLLHAQRTENWARAHDGEVAVSGLLSRVSTYLYDRGRWREREAVNVAALALRRRALGELHPDTISSRGSLAVTYQEQGKSKEAEEIKLEILQQRRDILGEKHEDTIWSMETLAITYNEQGRYNEAEKIKVEVLQLRREILGEKHPDTIKSMAELAATFYEQGRYNEDEEINTEVLQLRREILGEKHPDTIKSMADLAATFHEQGRYNEAEEIKVEVLQLRREILGEKHPDTIKSMAELAATFYEQGRYNEDEEINTEVLQLRREILGEKHPDTIWSMAELTFTYRALNKLEEAEKISSAIKKLSLSQT